MSIEEYIIDIVCDTLGCKENPCPYRSDKTKCPKQMDCIELCKYMCPVEEDDDRTD